MAWDPEIRRQVRHHYVTDKLDLEKAASLESVPVPTARKWKMADSLVGDDWDKARAAHSLTTSGASTIAQLVLHDFLIMYQETVTEVRDSGDVSPLDKAKVLSQLADSFQKTMSAVAKASPDLGRYAVATELMQDMADFVAETYPQYREIMVEILHPFGLHVTKKYG